MNSVVRRLKSSIVGMSMTALVLTVGAVTITATATASTPMVATTSVNMRSGPATSYAVLTVLSPQQEVSATGTVTNGWYEVVAAGRTGWVYKSYLQATGSAPAPTAPSATGTATTTAAVNVRSGPGTTYSIVATVAKGTAVATTGQTSSTWTQVIHGGVARWIATSYLTTGSVSTAPVTGQVRTTANLYLRTGGSVSSPSTGVLPANSIVDTTGRTTTDYTEIAFQGGLRWIATRYTTKVTTASPVVSVTPTSVGTRYVTVGSLYLRATSAATGTVVATVPSGTALEITGITEGDRTQVIWQGVARWAFTAYLSATAPSASGSVTIPAGVTTSGITKLNGYAKEVVRATLTNYPGIRTIYGWRASSAYSSDHPNGRAVDLMVSNWSSTAGSDYGWKVAKYFQANASRYHVKYIIWRQSSWNAAYPERGWRRMEDRGGATANHYDHVHVSVHDTP